VAAGVPTEGQALVHELALASLRGVCVRGPVAGRHHTWVLVRDWLGEPRPVERDRALSELARRYLAGHGPATERDLARWAGLPLRDARAGLRAIADELAEREDGLVDVAGRPPAEGMPPPRLLGAFDPVLLVWTGREDLLGPHASRIVEGGMFGPFALVNGRAAGTWRLRDGEVGLEPFRRLARRDAEALDEDAEDVVRFLNPRDERAQERTG
jgi:hypothetical protein